MVDVVATWRPIVHGGIGGAIALLFAACTTTPPQGLDVAAGSAEPGALDRICDIRRFRTDALRVEVSCPSSAPLSAQDVGAALRQGLDIPLIPGGPVSAGRTFDPRRAAISGVYYQFVVDTGERPLRIAPEHPPEAAGNPPDVATCVARYDLTLEGGATNICVNCAATGSRELFEDAVRVAVSRWLHAPASSADEPGRTGIEVEVPFDYESRSGREIERPPAPGQLTCSFGEGAE
jgi:hypothetical protein